MNIYDLPSIAILIDCWKTTEFDPQQDVCYQKIKNFLNCNTNIVTVVLTSYNCGGEHERSEHVWYKNNRRTCETATRKKIVHLRQAHDYLFKYDTKYPQEQTDPVILTYLT